MSIKLSKNSFTISTVALRDVSFFMRGGGGGLKILWGVQIFSEPKKGGSRFFPEFNIKYFLKKGMQYQKSEFKMYY